MQQQQYVNFKYANSFGNRCAIFARPTGVGDKRTEAFILECSKRDPFSRRKAREVYNSFLSSGGRESCYITRVIIQGKPIICYSDADCSPDQLCFNEEIYKKTICHPQIFVLPFEFNNERITRFCETFLKRWMSKQELKRHIAVIELAYQIEK